MTNHQLVQLCTLATSAVTANAYRSKDIGQLPLGQRNQFASALGTQVVDEQGQPSQLKQGTLGTHLFDVMTRLQRSGADRVCSPEHHQLVGRLLGLMFIQSAADRGEPLQIRGAAAGNAAAGNAAAGNAAAGNAAAGNAAAGNAAAGNAAAGGAAAGVVDLRTIIQQELQVAVRQLVQQQVGQQQVGQQQVGQQQVGQQQVGQQEDPRQIQPALVASRSDLDNRDMAIGSQDSGGDQY